MLKDRFLICSPIPLLMAIALAGCTVEHHPAEDSQTNSQNESSLDAPLPVQTTSDRASVNSFVQDLTDESVVMHQTLAIYLLGKSAVQDELELTDEQRQEVKQIKLNGIKQYFGLRNTVTTSEDDSGRQQAVRTALVIAHDVEKKLHEFLSDEQRRQLDQKVWQINIGPVTFARTGPLVLLHPDVEAALEISDDQRTAIATIAKETLQSVDESVSFVFAVDAANEILQEGRSRAELELTEIQKQKWDAMRGNAEEAEEVSNAALPSRSQSPSAN